MPQLEGRKESYVDWIGSWINLRNNQHSHGMTKIWIGLLLLSLVSVSCTTKPGVLPIERRPIWIEEGEVAPFSGRLEPPGWGLKEMKDDINEIRSM